MVSSYPIAASRLKHAALLTGLSSRRNAVSENIDGNLDDLLEEMGVESDESMQLDFAGMNALLPKRGRF